MKNLKVVVLLLTLVLFLLGACKLYGSIVETEKSFGDTYEECVESYEISMCNRIYFQ